MPFEPIAIVGAAARFPGAADLDAYWDVLIGGRDVVTEVPDDRWTKARFFHPEPGQPGKAYTFAAGVLGDVLGFDAAFFGISPREAAQIDPQQRLLLELAAEALEDAGVPAAKASGSRVGVFIGASGTEYGNTRLGDPAAANAYFMLGTTTGIAANRLSYVFDLKGPSFVVDTACSSSLVALDLACASIARGEVEMALCGGANMLLTPFPFVGFCSASMLSPDGRCFAFDARANGYVRAEGAGLVLLKPLKAALADGDQVRAVIAGTGVNSDGRTMGMSLPNGEAQARLLSATYERAGLSPSALSFVEAHGTGTAAGDPIEAGALGRVLGQARGAPLPIGSVKTNVGHLEVASGMAGLLKAMLAIERRTLPPSINFETPNPDIPFADLNLSVAHEATPLGSGPLAAGINSFGFGGTNAHAILTSAPEPVRHRPAAEGPLPPLLISARSQAALASLAAEWAERLEGLDPAKAAALVRGAARRRDQLRCRMVVSGETPDALAEALRSATSPASRVEGQAAEGRLAYVFTGNGAQWHGMGRDALSHSSAFRAAVERCDAILSPLTGWSVAERLTSDDGAEQLSRTDVAQPLLFAIQVGIVEALREQGVEPDGCMGHSVGEIAAAWAAGALTLEDACRIVVARSRHQQRTEGAGRMAALGLSPERAAEVLARLGGLELAAANSDSGVTVAGPRPALDRLRAEAAEQGWRYTPLDLDYAFHSAVLDPVREDLVADLAGLHGRPCGERFVSTVLGGAIAGEALDAEYWWANIRQTVRFSDAVRHMAGQGYRVFVEIGPHQILQSYIRENLKSAEVEGRVLASLTRQPTTRDPFPLLAARIHVAGGDLSVAPVYDGEAAFRDLPKHPWRRERFALPLTSEGFAIAGGLAEHDLLGARTNEDSFTWTNLLDTRLQPRLANHALEGAPLLPAAAMAEMALAAASARRPRAKVLELADFDMVRALALEEDTAREVRVSLTGDRIGIESRTRLSDEPFSLHAAGRVGAPEAGAPDPAPPFEPSGALEGAEVYEIAAAFGLDYGPAFRPVQRVEIGADGAARVHLDPALAEGGRLVEPVLLDGALQGFIALLGREAGTRGGETFLPARFGELRLHAPFGRAPVIADIRIARRGVRAVQGEAVLYDADGAAVATLKDAWFRRVALSRSASVSERTFSFGLSPAPLTEAAESAIDPAILLPAAGASPQDEETRLLFEAYLTACAYAAVDALTRPTAVFTPEDLVQAGVLARDSGHLFSALLSLLERFDLAARDKNGWRLLEAEGLAAPEVLWRTLIDERPELVAELSLAAAAFAELPAVLAEGPSRASAPPPALVDQLFTGSPAARAGISALVEAAGTIAEAWPLHRPLRILEVFSDGAALERRVRERLSAFAGEVSYRRAEARADEELPAGPFDLILCAYGLSRAGADETEAAEIASRLAPGGTIVAVDPEPSVLFDVLFGRGPDWWAGSLSPEFPVSAARTAAEWSELLDRQGLSGAAARLAGCPWGSVVLAAVSPPAAATEPAPIDRPVMVFAQAGDPLGEVLSETLIARGAAVELHHPPRTAPEAAFQPILAEAGERVAVILLPAQSTGPEEVAPRLAQILAAASGLGERTDADLFVVTRAALTDPAEAAAVGLARTLINEQPHLHVRLVDLEAGLAAGPAAIALADELSAGDGELEVSLRTDGRFAARLRRGLPAAPPPKGPVALSAAQPGLLDSLRWTAASGRAPGPGEVAIAVEAAGLNFRDLMWAQGLLPEEALIDGFAGATLGLECAGRVEAVGEGVTHLAPGDRVMAFAPAALAERAITAAHATVRLPEGVGFEEGATLPVAYLTVIYALGRLARLGPDETVLIHGGAGGVGQAAIQYARRLGAKVIATAGSETKREFLRQLGADHVFDSRSLSFVEGVRAATDGRGVDVVLNSLSGEAMEASLRLVAPFGRFCELGKRDFYADTQVGLRPMRRNVSYFAVDADSLPLHRPELARALMEEAADLVAEGELRPLPYRLFGFSEVVDAFRLMQSAGHIGKIVLRPDRTAAASAPQRAPAPAIRPDRTYLVTGGLSGFGLATARRLAEQGARNLALVSRSGAGAPGAAEVLAAFEAAGVDARAFACDVSDAENLAALLERVRREMAPIGGIVHAAMVLDDGLLSEMTQERLETVLAPKAIGAINLDRATRTDSVEHFILFSSATTALGAPGQGSYVAANCALEALARARRAEGLPAIAVGWGPIADAGVLAREEATREALARRLSAHPMTAAEALDALPALIGSGLAAPAFCAVQWDAARRRLPILASPAFAAVGAMAGEGEDIDLVERLAGLSAEEAREVVAGLVAEEIAKILSSSPDRIDPARPLSELGMDSLMAVELRLTLEQRLGVSLPLLSLGEATTLASLAGRVTRMALEGRSGDDAFARAALRHETDALETDKPAAVIAAE